MDLIKDFNTFNEKEKITEKYPLYSQDGKQGEALVVAKYFLPGTGASWYVLEASPEGGSITFFGLVTGLVPGGDELGYFSLMELAEVEIPIEVAPIDKIKVGIERDLHFTPKTLKEAAPEYCAYYYSEEEDIED